MRINDEPIEIIESRSESEPAKLTGYGAVFYNGLPQTEYVLWDDHRGKAVERILPEAFDNVISNLPNESIDLRYDHKPDWTIDNTLSTMKITKDSKGIKVESKIDPSDPQYQTVVAKVKKRIIKGMSFGFRQGLRSQTKEVWGREGNVDVCWLKNIDCFEFSVAPNPCYGATTSSIRSQSDDMHETELSWLRYQTQLREENLKKWS